MENWDRNPLYYTLNILKKPMDSFEIHIFPETFHLKRGVPGGGTPHIKGVGMLVKTLKETDLGVAQAFFDP